MLLDISRLYADFHVSTAPYHHKHARRGWINTPCPFHQGNPGYHLGYNLEKGYFFCWSCGWHPTDLTVQILTNTDKREAKSLLQRYKSKLDPGYGLPDSTFSRKVPDELKWPEGCGPMTDIHKTYLSKRLFDPEQLEKEWGLLGTDNWGQHAFRVIAPITFRSQPVSWQGRDITDKQRAKYLPCPNEQEILPHKHLLYGFDKARWETVVVVEGITGVWRLGPGSVGTFGVKYTASQLLLLQSFEKVIIFYDGDMAGQEASDKMGVELTGIGHEVEIWEPFKNDSGDIPQSIANELMKEVRI